MHLVGRRLITRLTSYLYSSGLFPASVRDQRLPCHECALVAEELRLAIQMLLSARREEAGQDSYARPLSFCQSPRAGPSHYSGDTEDRLHQTRPAGHADQIALGSEPRYGGLVPSGQSLLGPAPQSPLQTGRHAGRHAGVRVAHPEGQLACAQACALLCWMLGLVTHERRLMNVRRSESSRSAKRHLFVISRGPLQPELIVTGGSIPTRRRPDRLGPRRCAQVVKHLGNQQL